MNLRNTAPQKKRLQTKKTPTQNDPLNHGCALLTCLDSGVTKLFKRKRPSAPVTFPTRFRRGPDTVPTRSRHPRIFRDFSHGPIMRPINNRRAWFGLWLGEHFPQIKAPSRAAHKHLGQAPPGALACTSILSLHTQCVTYQIPEKCEVTRPAGQR